jgi:hypothetical protein
MPIPLMECGPTRSDDLEVLYYKWDVVLMRERRRDWRVLGLKPKQAELLKHPLATFC